MKKSVIILLLIVAIVAAYWVTIGNPLHLFKRKLTPDPTPGTDPQTVNQPIGTSTVNGSFVKAPAIVQDKNGFPLMEGSRNSYVSIMQKALNDRYGSELVVDGVFGPKTAKALSAHGFNPSAIYYKHYYEIIGKA